MEDEKEKALEYLKKDLKYLGFGEGLYAALEQTVSDKPEKFKLMYNTSYARPDGTKDEMQYQIDFKKSDKTERYFLNSYTATLKNETDPTKEKVQTFYVDKGSGVTAKEAYNLLEGRAVHKELTNKDKQEYKAWLQLDFSSTEPNGNFKIKQFHENYGFNLSQTLMQFPIKELNHPDAKSGMISSLEKGNIRHATLIRNGSEERIYITASPQFKKVNLFDSVMKPLSLGIEKKQQEPDQKKEKKEAVKPGADEEHSEKSDTKRKRKSVKV